ncbi:hypothetical protein DFP72DRAFT_47401 [Ephemerocybe angulata]|uniref:MYND-type domain-containing protein n=1 Tax=Ephemerocybe angulata TaxID=980116 RepID=A0A8H6HES8_9AGAR|nr:hypothetical protein DFP72DRAFT_47401 [Tulosesus angulatus]
MLVPWLLDELLGHVRNRSEDHCHLLVYDWPSSSTIKATKALIEALSVEKEPSDIEMKDLIVTDLCLEGIAAAMHAAEAGPRTMKKELTDLIIKELDILFSSFSMVVRHIGLHPDDAHPHKYTTAFIAKSCIQLMLLMNYERRLADAMRCSLAVSDFVVLAWTWSDPHTRLPLFMVDEFREDAERSGCVINDMFAHYTRGPSVAKTLVLEHLSGDRDPYAAADRLLLTGIARAQAIRRACECDGWDPIVVLRNLVILFQAMDNFLRLGSPVLLAAFRRHTFLQALMSAIAMASGRLVAQSLEKTTFTKARGVGEYLSPAAFLNLEVRIWVEVPGTSPMNAIVQLLQGGILSVLLDLLLLSLHERTALNQDDFETCQECCRGLVTWLAPYCVYPLVAVAMDEAVANVDRWQLEKINEAMKIRRGYSVGLPMTPWLLIGAWCKFGKRKLSMIQGCSKPPLCDNILHDQSKRDGISPEQIYVCARCHSATYCSSTCQKVDWALSHRDDCPKLQKSYLERRTEHDWIFGSTRQHLLLILQDAYRKSAHEIEQERREHHPRTPPFNLVVSFNYITLPAIPEAVPVLYTLAQYVATLVAATEGPNGALEGLGCKRLNAMLEEFTTKPDVRIVEGLFMLRNRRVRVIARVRLARTATGYEIPDRATVLGGISHLGPKYLLDCDIVDEDHPGFCKLGCKCATSRAGY